MTTMNSLLRAHGGFDVVSGGFAFYSEMKIKDGYVNGYVKPLFKDLVAYDADQDREKGFVQKLKERAVNVVGKVMKNMPRKGGRDEGRHLRPGREPAVQHAPDRRPHRPERVLQGDITGLRQLAEDGAGERSNADDVRVNISRAARPASGHSGPKSPLLIVGRSPSPLLRNARRPPSAPPRTGRR